MITVIANESYEESSSISFCISFRRRFTFSLYSFICLIFSSISLWLLRPDLTSSLRTAAQVCDLRPSLSCQPKRLFIELGGRFFSISLVDFGCLDVKTALFLMLFFVSKRPLFEVFLFGMSRDTTILLNTVKLYLTSYNCVYSYYK